MNKILILGSTGSIGRQTLAVIADHAEHFDVVGLSGHSRLTELADQARTWRPQRVALSGGVADGWSTEVCPVACGDDALSDLARDLDYDIVVNAVSGAAGLRATYEAVLRGKRVAVANKESLVAAGPLLMARARQSGAEILPVDSEHSAIWQALRAGRRDEVRRIHLTASGGPFRGATRSRLEQVTVEEALRHPTWSMGRKITIDSATLMNKGLELIEATVLFDLPPDAIEVVVHPQSAVHSLVEFHDGTYIAHLGATDMRIPIQYALSQPQRWTGPDVEFSLTDLGQLTFETVDDAVFPSIQLARAVCRAGNGAPTVFNAANEEAVKCFLAGQIPFVRIFEWVEKALELHDNPEVTTLESILALDARTRKSIAQWKRS